MRANGPREVFSRDEIGDRDDWTCGICWGRIDRHLQDPEHPMMQSLDHIVPIARGGPHTRANVRITHASCNTSRNHRTSDPAPYEARYRLARATASYEALLYWRS
ncbi:HNH endonuclease [Jiangella aurantiaca]|nr:HNH endonuclease [Jiangella aurantiaca]